MQVIAVVFLICPALPRTYANSWSSWDNLARFCFNFEESYHLFGFYFILLFCGMNWNLALEANLEFVIIQVKALFSLRCSSPNMNVHSSMGFVLMGLFRVPGVNFAFLVPSNLFCFLGYLAFSLF